MLIWCLDTPVLMAPIGVQTISHTDRETGLAEVCASIGIPFILSTAASSSIEEVAEANGSGNRWFQLYCTVRCFLYPGNTLIAFRAV